MTIHIPIPTGRFRHLAILLAACALIALLIGPAAIAQEGTPPEGVAVVDPSDPQAISTFRTGAALQVIAVANPEPFTTNSSTFVNVPGSIVRFTVPTGQTRTVIARYAAESVCDAPNTNSHSCSVRININGVEMLPAVGTDFVFDSNSPIGEAHALERVIQLTTAGSYTLVVQARTGFRTYVRLDDSLLTVEIHSP